MHYFTQISHFINFALLWPIKYVPEKVRMIKDVLVYLKE